MSRSSKSKTSAVKGRDSEGKRLEEVFSEGFATDANYDPFQSGSPSSRPSKRGSAQTGVTATPPIEASLEPSLPDPGKVQFNTPKEVEGIPKKDMPRGTKSGNLLKSGGMKSQGVGGTEELLNLEEERLQMLPDCCEFIVRKHDAPEVLDYDGKRDMSSAWFEQIKLTPLQQKHLCFSESLLMVEETGAVVGKHYCSVSPSKWNGKPCLCVHAGSYGKFSTGLESGTSITSFVSFNLKPLQEFCHEWASLPSSSPSGSSSTLTTPTSTLDTIERKIVLMQETGQMPVKITLHRNGVLVDTKQWNLGARDRANLVTEGSSVVLQRLLVQDRRTTGSMIVQSLSYTGKVVRAKFGELGSGWENVKGKQMKTWGLQRHVWVSDDEERLWDSLFTKNGRLILRCQPDSPQALIPLWFESVLEFDKNGNFIGSHSPHTWACDAELYSKYTVKKDELTYDHRRYLLDHPEVRALLSDYLQTILFRKPKNTLEFTKYYFEQFINLKPPAPKKSHTRKTEGAVSSTGYYDSSYVMAESSVTEGEGEWLGEGEDASFYAVNPKVNYDGLEQVEEEEERGGTTEGATNTWTEDELEVNEKGEYTTPGGSQKKL